MKTLFAALATLALWGCGPDETLLEGAYEMRANLQGSSGTCDGAGPWPQDMILRFNAGTFDPKEPATVCTTERAETDPSNYGIDCTRSAGFTRTTMQIHVNPLNGTQTLLGSWKSTGNVSGCVRIEGTFTGK